MVLGQSVQTNIMVCAQIEMYTDTSNIKVISYVKHEKNDLLKIVEIRGIFFLISTANYIKIYN